jgi:hypothetical protein
VGRDLGGFAERPNGLYADAEQIDSDIMLVQNFR